MSDVNPFTDAQAWDPHPRQLPLDPPLREGEEPQPLEPSKRSTRIDDRVTFETMAGFAMDEPECKASQERIAKEVSKRLGRTVDQATICRSIARLRRARWVRIKDRPVSERTGRRYCVYELLAPLPARAAAAAKRIVRHAHRRARRFGEAKRDWLRSERRGPMPFCVCEHCRPDRPRSRRPPPTLPAVRWWRDCKVRLEAMGIDTRELDPRLWAAPTT